MKNYFKDIRYNNISKNSITKISAISLIVIFTVLILIFFTNHIFASSSFKEDLKETDQFEVNQNTIDITEILNKNKEKVRREFVYEDERDIGYTTVRNENDKLPEGEIKVIKEGKKGKEQIFIKKVFENDQLIEQDTIVGDIIKSPVAQIVEIGTLQSSNKSVSTNKNTYDNRKSKAFSKLGFNMDLREHSGLTFKDFQKIVANDERDRYKVFANNIETFYCIEQKYNINGIFVMALAIHESGWGASAISKDKKNLFGYGAYDSSPYQSSYNFDDYAEGIELVSKALVKHYLNKEGTRIFDGQVATGSFYNGPNLAGVNVKYASDPEWGIKIFNIMEYLYGKL